MSACPQCGAVIYEGQRFCTRCGARLSRISGRALPPDVAARIDIYEKRISQTPLQAGLYLELGDIYWEHSLAEEAVVQFQKAAAIEPANYQALLKSGRAFSKLGNHEHALQCYLKAAAANPEAVEPKLGQFDALVKLNRQEDAVNLATEILQRMPQALEVRHQLVTLLMAAGRLDEATAHLETLIAASSPSTPVKLQLARLYLKTEQYDKALYVLRNIVEAAPQSTEARLLLGRLLIDPRRSSSPHGADEAREAAGHLEFVLQQDPANTSVRAMLADALVKAGRHADAERVLSQLPDTALQQTPPADRELLATALAAVGRFLLENNRPEQALLLLRRGYLLNPSPELSRLLTDLYRQLGDSASGQNNWSTAVSFYTAALQYSPDDVLSKERLSMLRAQLRRQRARILLAVLVPVLTSAVLAVAYLIWQRFGFGRLSLAWNETEVASVTVDGRPWTGVHRRIQQGTHTVSVTGRPGYADTTLRVRVPGGGSVHIDIAPTYLVRPIQGLTATASSSGRDYPPANAIDGDTTTCWTEAEGQTCVGQWLQFNLPRRLRVTAIAVYPGYGKPHPVYGSLFWLNNRLQQAELLFSDSTTRTLDFANEQCKQTIAIDQPVEAEWVRFIVRDYYEGALWDDLCISEVEFLGY